MKKIILVLVMLMVMVLIIATTVSASKHDKGSPAEKEQSTEVVEEEKTLAQITDPVNVRVDAKENSEIIGVIERGEIVEVIATEGAWTHIKKTGPEDDILDGYVYTTFLNFDPIVSESAYETESIENEAETETETEITPLSLWEVRKQFDYYREYGYVQDAISQKITGGTDWKVRELVLATIKMDQGGLKYDYMGDAYGFIIKGNYTLDDEYGMFKEQKRFEAIYVISIYSGKGKLESFYTVD